jgi:hypothetical protein
MRSKYFRCLNQKDLEKLDSEEKIQYLLDHGLLVKTYSSSGLTETDKFGFSETTISLSNNNLKYEFKPELAKEVYEFLLKHYASGIGTDLIQFKIQFEDETFTLSDKKKRIKGLVYFDAYFKRAIGDRQIGLEYNANNEIVPEKRFKTLFDAREDLIYQLRKLHPIIIDYLLGLKEKFDRKLFETDDVIQNIFSFEYNLSILIYLNKLFDIEDEDFFTPKSIAIQIYENYPDQFYSLKQIEFIEEQLSFKENKFYGYVISRYFSFKKELKIMIPKATLFKEIVNNYFDLNISKIQLSDPNNNEHELRMKLIQHKWKEFN